MKSYLLYESFTAHSTKGKREGQKSDQWLPGTGGERGVLTTKEYEGASLVAQWLRICLLMQGTQVRALVWEDPTCRRAAGPVSHNY